MLALIGLLAHLGCAATAPARYPAPLDPSIGFASHIAESLAGNPTASGAPFDPHDRVAAHRTLPLGTRLRVTNLANGRSVIVTVLDRGPYRKGRIVDVSPRVARELGFYRRGVARVRLEVVSRPHLAGGEQRPR